MKVFISHSGERSRTLANKMKWFVGNILQATDPWVSTGIEKGARWIPEIAEQLDASAVGIVCLTAENLDSRWILFESGALAKRLGGRVCTLLLDVKPEQVLAPLDQFQHTVPEKEDMWKLVTTIMKALNDAGAKPPSEADVRKSFDDYFWPEVEKAIAAIQKQAAPVKAPERPEREMLAELLDIARQTAGAAGMQEKTLHLVRRIHESVFLEESPTLAALRRELLVRELAKTTEGSSLYEMVTNLGGETTQGNEGKHPLRRRRLRTMAGLEPDK